jgi:xylono-1,5-lactonase
LNDFQIIQREHRDVLGEGPLWSSRQQSLFWVDIKGMSVNRLSLVSQSVDRWQLTDNIGWLIERQDHGSMVAGLRTGVAILDLDPIHIQMMAALEPDQPNNRLNDAKADAQGRIFAGTMEHHGQGAHGALYRIDPDFSTHLLDTGYGVANGPALSPDQTTLYHTDSARGVIYAFDLADNGGVENKRDFICFPSDWGAPDGMTTDVEGGLWVAHWDGGRVSRFTPDGRLDRAITLPASRITSCTFAGEDLDRMFITSASDGREDEPHAGALFEVDPGVCGLPTPYFAG